MAESNDDRVAASRRTVLAGVGAVGVVGSLAACGTASDNASDGGAANGGGSTPTAAGASTGGGGTSGGGIAKTADIPVGSGKIIGSVVVTQPSAGTFKAFSSTCTHQGCQVNAISGGAIKCPCHGSQFSITDGSVKHGPATAPLPSKTVTVKDGEITVA
jgi:Rieske Fe-S protein